jgi:histidinol-phosphate/aromatic aminotransferase/cobyric acid decarboxylase-like protein
VELIYYITQCYLAPGDETITSETSFSAYTIASRIQDGVVRTAPLSENRYDLPALANLVTDRTKLVFIANPNNPTGTFIPAAEIQAFLDQVPANVVVVLDEAYNEFLAEENQFESAEWVKKYPNLLVSRTFSKAYGLAGLRVGFGIAQPALTDLMNRIRQPFNVNSMAQAAAIASSMSAAENVLKSLHRVGEVRKPSVQQAGFVVLKSPDIPSMLVETAFISNREEERKLNLPAHRQKLANAIFDGIELYFQGNAPEGTRLAAVRRDGSGGNSQVELR